MMDIEANDIAVRFGRTTVLEGVRFKLHAGEMVGLIGPNGAGKTSLLRILANLRAPDAGSVRYGGRSAADIGNRELAQQVTYLAQAEKVHWPMRAQPIVSLGPPPHHRPMQGHDSADQAE